jgi:hypothetical protein
MVTDSTNKQIIDKLDDIKSDLDYIKSHMADVDSIMTDDDLNSMIVAEQELKAGRTKRL